MAESNPKIANVHIPIPAGNDVSGKQFPFSGVAKNTPVPGSQNEDDHIAVNSLEKNAAVPAGGDENHDLSMEVNGGRNPQSSYQSKKIPLWPYV